LIVQSYSIHVIIAAYDLREQRSADDQTDNRVMIWSNESELNVKFECYFRLFSILLIFFFLFY